jgi:multiple sugar transport system substrate-binding protein
MPAYYKIGLLFTLLVLSVACSSSLAPTPPSIPTPAPLPTPETVTITWAFWGEPWEVAINERIIEVFETDYPHIRVETFHRPWNSYFTELRAKFQANEPVADVLFWAEVPNDVPKGYFMDLTPRVEAENYDLVDFFPALLAPFQVNDRIYGLPRDSDTKVIYYNKRLFNRAGVSYPRSGWSWDDLRELSLALKQAEVAEYSFAYEANDWWMIWMWQNGVQVFDDKFAPTSTDLEQPAAAEAAQFLADLTNVDQVTPPYEQLNSSDIASLFTENNLAMAFGNHALIPAFAQAEGLEWDVVGLPQKERRANLAAGAGYVIAANTDEPDAAWTFLKFLSGPKGQAIFAESGVAVPARRSVAQSDVFMEQRPAHNARVFLEETEIGEANPNFPGADESMSLLNETLVPVWRGQQDAVGVLKGIVPQIEAIIANNRQPQIDSSSP